MSNTEKCWKMLKMLKNAEKSGTASHGEKW
jgi:hypothetical protein